MSDVTKPPFQTVTLSKRVSLAQTWHFLGATKVIGINWGTIPPNKYQGGISWGWFMAKIKESWVPCHVWLEEDPPPGVPQHPGRERRRVVVYWCEARQTCCWRKAVLCWVRQRVERDLSDGDKMPDGPLTLALVAQARQTLERLRCFEALHDRRPLWN